MCLWDASPLNASLLPAFHQASMTIHLDPFILLGGERERGTVRIKFFAQEHNTLTWPGLNSDPLPQSPVHYPLGRWQILSLMKMRRKVFFWSHHK